MDEVTVSYDDIGRIYHVHDKKFYSVTTCLGSTGDHSFLERWKKTNPDHEKIKEQAAKLGTDYHSLGEKYLLGEPLPDVQWFAQKLFQNTISKLSSVNETLWTEKFLYNEKIRLAGRADAIVIWNGKLAILDFKCLNHVRRDYLSDYWLQTAIYAFMYSELFQERPLKLILVCANKKTFKTEVFEDHPDNHARQAAKRIYDFHNLIKEKYNERGFKETIL